MESSEFRENRGTGLILGPRSVVRDSYLHRNGQQGLGGPGDDGLVERNEIAHNNTRGVEPGFSAGGHKWCWSRGVIVRDNWVHSNKGMGIWSDCENVAVTIEGNVVTDNDGPGIFVEITYGATVKGNHVARNGFVWQPAWCYGAGILIAHSPDVTVEGNTVEDNHTNICAIQQERGSGHLGPFHLKNLLVRGNTVKGSGESGVAQGGGMGFVFDAVSNNRFRENHYHVPDVGGRYWTWRDATRTWSEWQGFGHDLEGSVSRR